MTRLFAGELVRDTANAEEDEDRGESLPLSTMRNPVLPVSDPPLAGENDTDGKGVDDRLFKGSAMTKRGAYAALSYMACAGNRWSNVHFQIPADISMLKFHALRFICYWHYNVYVLFWCLIGSDACAIQ